MAPVVPLSVVAAFAYERLSKLRYKLGPWQRLLLEELTLKFELKRGEELIAIGRDVQSHVLDKLGERLLCLGVRWWTSAHKQAAPMMRIVSRQAQ